MQLVGSISVGSLRELQVCGKALASVLTPGLMLGFSGELGVGKTEFVRQILRSLGVLQSVSSPTFVLETQYEIPALAEQAIAYHWDLYRLSSELIPEDLIDRSRENKALCCIEWPEKIPALLDLLDIRIMIAFAKIEAKSDPQVVLPMDEPERIISLYSDSDSESELIVKSFLEDVSRKLPL